MAFRTPAEIVADIESKVRSKSASFTITKDEMADMMRDTVESYQLSLLLPSGATAAASGLTRASKVAAGSGVQSLTAGATTVPLASDVAAGMSLLRSSVLWGSSVAVGKTTSGKAWTQADMLAATTGNLDVVADSTEGADPTSVILRPDTTGGPPGNHYARLTTGIALGKRVRMTGYWTPTANAQCDSMLMWSNATAAQFTTQNTGALINGTVGLATANAETRSWKNADGVHQFCFEFTSSGDGYIYLLPGVVGATNFVGDGTSGIRIWGVVITEVLAATIENLSDSGTCTLTSTNVLIEDSICPENGWKDGTDVLKFWGLSSRTIAISATGYQAISGTAQPFTLVHVAAPYQTPLADGNIWSFAGAGTDALKLELTTADRLRLTRTNTAGVTSTAYFTTVVGHVPCIYEVVADGTNALLYRQGALVETIAFSLAGTTTFTSGAFGGALPLRVAELCLFSGGLTATECYQVALALGVARSVSLDPIPVLLGVSQSNGLRNGFGVPLANTGAGYPGFGSLGERTGALMCILQSDAEHNQGWGPSRFLHWTDWPDAATPTRTNNSSHASGNMYYNWELGFHEMYAAPVATITFGVGGTAIAQFMSGGAQNAAMLAAFQGALDTIGLPYYIAGFVPVFGEDDAQSIATADIFHSQLRALADELGAEFVDDYLAGDLPIVFPLLSRKCAGRTYPQLLIARSRQGVASDYKMAATETDDLELSPADSVHYYGTTQLTVGRRLASAARSLGL